MIRPDRIRVRQFCDREWYDYDPKGEDTDGGEFSRARGLEIQSFIQRCVTMSQPILQVITISGSTWVYYEE